MSSDSQQGGIPKTALLLALLVGAVSLSQEIVWVRLASFMTAARPETFGVTLGCFLIGIAVGALIGKRICNSGIDGALACGWMLLGSAIFFLACLPLTGFIAMKEMYWPVGVLVALTAAIAGGVFPIVCQMADRAGAAGPTISLVYLANIIGATVGSLATGFILLDVLPVHGVAVWVGIAGAASSLFAFAVADTAKGKKIAGALAAPILIVASILVAQPHFDSLLERLQYKTEFNEKPPFKYVYEGRSGVITIEEGEDGGPDIIYGGGIYDGRFAVYPGAPNGIFRCHMIAALHRNPRKVLEIGLSSGSWTAALLQHEAVEELDVIEINKWYVDAIEKYPPQAAALKDPRLKLHIDDGRRFLRLTDESTKFDFILMNTTHHWRSHSSNLLSKEFLELAKSRLTPEGVIYYNSTGSKEVLRTAAEVFEHVTMVSNFVAASSSPFDISREERRKQLLRFKNPDGAPVFLQTEAYRVNLEELLGRELPELGPITRQSDEFPVVTDDNMATEFKPLRNPFQNDDATWSALFRRMKNR